MQQQSQLQKIEYKSHNQHLVKNITIIISKTWQTVSYSAINTKNHKSTKLKIKLKETFKSSRRSNDQFRSLTTVVILEKMDPDTNSALITQNLDHMVEAMPRIITTRTDLIKRTTKITKQSIITYNSLQSLGKTAQRRLTTRIHFFSFKSSKTTHPLPKDYSRLQMKAILSRWLRFRALKIKRRWRKIPPHSFIAARRGKVSRIILIFCL